MGAIQQDIHWLGFDWGDFFFGSDYFEEDYRQAVGSSKGLAYVCQLTPGGVQGTGATSVCPPPPTGTGPLRKPGPVPAYEYGRNSPTAP